MTSTDSTKTADTCTFDQLRISPNARLGVDWLIDLYDRRRWFFLLLLAGIYLIGFTGQWHPEPDSAMYLTIGRNLARGEGFTYLGEPNALAYPGLPYLIGGAFWLFGPEAQWAARLIIFLFALACLGLAYRLYYLHSDARTAIFLTCMFGSSYSLYHYTTEIRNDVPFTVGVLAVLVGLESWRRFYFSRSAAALDQSALPDGGTRSEPSDCRSIDKVQPKQVRRSIPWCDSMVMLVGLLLAMTMRPHAWVLLGALAGAGAIALLKTRKRRAIVLTGLVAMVLLILAVIYADPRSGARTYEMDILRKAGALTTPVGWNALTQNGWKLLNSTVSEATLSQSIAPGLTVIYSSIILMLGVGLIRYRWVWGLFIIGTLVMVLVVLPLPRYLLPILPLLVLAWFKAMVWINRRWGRPWGNVVFATMLVMWVMPNFVKIIRLAAEQRSTYIAEKYGDAAAFSALHKLADSLSAQLDRDDFVIAHYKVARILAYWADRNIAAGYELPASAWTHRLYLLEPMDEQMQQMIQNGLMRLGPQVASYPMASQKFRRLGPRWVLTRLLPPVAGIQIADPDIADSQPDGSR
ncbi:MAG: hypothetical protein IT448_06215 [Phycisphaerales bacterium]|nr:hypothetical protein [Phycisphaerales bacterium]